MNAGSRWTCLTALGVALGLVALLAAPAVADHGGARRYKGWPGDAPRVVNGWGARHVIVRHEEGPGPALAGFFGGLILGAAISHAVPPPPPPRVEYVYVDPYCHEEFDSYDAYLHHLRHHHHAYLVEVVDPRSGDCLDTREWRDGTWVRVHPDVDDEDRGSDDDD